MQTNLRHNYSSLIFLFESRNSASVFNFPWKNQCNSIESKNTHSEDENWILRNQYMEKQVATHRLQNINSWNIIAFPEKKIQTETTENRFEKNEPVVLITTTTPNSSKNSTSKRLAKQHATQSKKMRRTTNTKKNTKHDVQKR